MIKWLDASPPKSVHVCNEEMGELIKVEAGGRPPAGNKGDGRHSPCSPQTPVADDVCELASDRQEQSAEGNTTVADKQIPLKTEPQSEPLASPRPRSPVGAAKANCISSNNKHAIRTNDITSACCSNGC